MRVLRPCCRKRPHTHTARQGLGAKNRQHTFADLARLSRRNKIRTKSPRLAKICRIVKAHVGLVFFLLGHWYPGRASKHGSAHILPPLTHTRAHRPLSLRTLKRRTYLISRWSLLDATRLLRSVAHHPHCVLSRCASSHTQSSLLQTLLGRRLWHSPFEPATSQPGRHKAATRRVGPPLSSPHAALAARVMRRVVGDGVVAVSSVSPLTSHTEPGLARAMTSIIDQ